MAIVNIGNSKSKLSNLADQVHNFNPTVYLYRDCFRSLWRLLTEPLTVPGICLFTHLLRQYTFERKFRGWGFWGFRRKYHPRELEQENDQS